MKKLSLAIVALWLIALNAWGHDDVTPIRGGYEDEGVRPYTPSEVGVWCSDRVRILRRAYDEALDHYQVLNIKAAEDVLYTGLKRASTNIDPYYVGALTARAITRGVYLVDSIRESLAGNKRQKKTTVHFLFEYYDFIIDVAEQLDTPFYSYEPTTRRRYHRAKAHREFERKYIRFSKKQVQMVLGSMATRGRRGGQSTIYPLGAAKGFLVSLEITADSLANDLDESLFAEQFACEIDELFYLSDKLHYYNTEGVGYPNDVYAVNRSYHAATDIVGPGCAGGSGWYDGEYQREKQRTKTIRRKDFIVHNRVRTLELDGQHAGYIEKLIVFAEGVRNDAMVQVTINGRPAKGPHKDIKGTIYVPGKDPKYYVTIGEDVQTIEFHPEFGKTRVLKVRAIYDHRWW